MKKTFIVVFMMMVMLMVTGNVASAHETVYYNSTVDAQAETDEVTSVEFIIYGVNFRTSMELNIFDTQETVEEKAYQFGYEFGQHYAEMILAGEDADSEIYYVLMVVDGKTAYCNRGTGKELIEQFTESETNNTMSL